jgi:peptidase YpeB-like protein/fungalysin/thermolysin propeptide
MIPALLLAAALGLGGVDDFRAAFPSASIVESPAGGRLTQASRFEARGLGRTPEAAARAFLARYGAAFGIGPRERLVARGAPAPGRPGAVRFERRLDGLSVFDAEVVVGVDARNAVILVNASDAPREAAGSARLSRKAAIRAARAAIPGLESSDEPRTARGWKGFGPVLRPVWRVDLAAARPPGDWRSYVDAETGKVLLRVDLRASGGAGTGIAPGRPSLAPDPR